MKLIYTFIISLFIISCNKNSEIEYQFDNDYIFNDFKKEFISYDLNNINDSISERKTLYKDKLIRTDTLLSKNQKSKFIGWTKFYDTIENSNTEKFIENFRFKNNIIKFNQLIVKENDTINYSKSFFYKFHDNKIIFYLPEKMKFSRNFNNEILFFLLDDIENPSVNLQQLFKQKSEELNFLTIHKKSNYSEAEYLIDPEKKNLKGIFVYFEYEPKTFDIITHSILHIKR